MVIPSKLYDVLKWVAMIVLPAAASFYMGMGQIWNWPETDKVGTSIVLFNTFLGAVLQLSSIKYKNDPKYMEGFLEPNGVNEDTGIPGMRLVITTPPEEILAGDVARFKVSSSSANK